jgi:phosphoglycolate phosphatase
MLSSLESRRAILFDLDGTLVDTAADIGCALNRMLRELDAPEIPQAVVRTMIGSGTAVLVDRALAHSGLVVSDRERLGLVRRFLILYADLLDSGATEAEPYPGAEWALAGLADTGIPIAVVTNKEQRLAALVLSTAGLSRYVDLLVGGGACSRRKPDPAMLLHACAELAVKPGEAVMVGDSVNDIRAARAARMPVIAATYGYLGTTDPQSLCCDGYVDRLAELPGRISVHGALIAQGVRERMDAGARRF